MARDRVEYWQQNELEIGKDFTIGAWRTTPKNMTENATLGWGDRERGNEEFGTSMKLKTPRWTMFASPRPPQDTESRFDAQLCFPIEMPKTLAYSTTEIESCKAFVRCIQKLNERLFEYYKRNCRRIINWDPMYRAMGYKKTDDIPEKAMIDWIDKNSKMRASLFDFTEAPDDDTTDDEELGIITIHDTRWFKIKVKINGEVPDTGRQMGEYVFGSRKRTEPGGKKPKSIKVVTNAKLASNVFVSLAVNLNGRRHYVDLWPPQAPDADDDDVVGEGKLTDLVKQQTALQQYKRKVHANVGSDVEKIFPRLCTGQSVIWISHLMRKFVATEPCIPLVRVFANQHTVIHPTVRAQKRTMELDSDMPEGLMDDIAAQDDEFFATPMTAAGLFGAPNMAVPDQKDEDLERLKKFQKTTTSSGDSGTISVKDMKEQLARRKEERDKK